jgi:pyruvate dehydrogenase E2 component (dihydrolipoamide acetyltransferase)
MAREVTVPRLGWTMEEGTFGGWLKADGDSVREGDELFLLESDKATETITALDCGILRIPSDAPRQGDTVRVGQRLAYVVAPGEATPAVAAATAPTESRRERETASHKMAPVRAKRAASPRARRAAHQLGVNLSVLQGSGRSGRIRERDVRKAAAQAPSPDRPVPLTPLRRRIAERMAASAHTTAAVTLTTKADATSLKQFRERCRAQGGLVPGYTELFVLITAKALARHPQLNARWQSDGIVLCGGIHLGVAVDTEAGLVAPVIHDADRLTIDQLAAQLAELINRARARTLNASQLQGGTFTITNLGMYGIDAFTPIINLPECAVLGVGRVMAEPAVRDGKIVPRDMVTLSLTFDHRIIDGAPAARFLNEVRQLIEQDDFLCSR